MRTEGHGMVGGGQPTPSGYGGLPNRRKVTIMEENITYTPGEASDRSYPS